MQLSGGVARTTITDSNGITNLTMCGSHFYTVTPALVNYHFQSGKQFILFVRE